MVNGIEILREALRTASEVAAETVWPTRCAVCDAPGELICESCMKKLPVIDACLACPACGAPYGRMQCTECTPIILAGIGRSSVPFDGIAHAMTADDAVRRIVRAHKDKSERRLAGFIAKASANYISPDWMQDCVLTYIPDTDKAYRQRGFDHARELARAVADEAQMDCVGMFLRPRATDQRKLSRKERFENMASSMTLAPDAPIPRSVIIFDDICTTGSTLYAAADALRVAGCEKIYGLAFGRMLD